MAAKVGESVTHSSKATALTSFERNWPLYLFEGLELAIFMISACACTVFLFDPSYSAIHRCRAQSSAERSWAWRWALTAVLIIHSPMGKRSGAHFNPAITLTYLRLRKIATGMQFFT